MLVQFLEIIQFCLSLIIQIFQHLNRIGKMIENVSYRHHLQKKWEN